MMLYLHTLSACALLGILVFDVVHLSVTSSTIISNSAAFFVFVFNVLSNTETYTMCKAVGVALAICGAVAVRD